MLDSTTLNYILGIIALGSVVFTIWGKVSKPQEAIEIKQALTDKDLVNKASLLAQKELETKALVLAEQVKNKDIENERRFNEMGVRLDTAMTTAQNHIHTVDVKVDALITTTNAMNLNIMKLQTVIEERLPYINK